MILRIFVVAAVVLAMLLGRSERGSALGAEKANAAQAKVKRGRYVTLIGGCNDCHTPTFEQVAGAVPDSAWLTGSSMGFRGPWGTSYPVNLRSMVQRMSEKEWVNFVSTYEALPPMPWWALHAMDREDLSAVYQFVKSLGPAGEEAPAPLPPDVEPTTPYISFMPVFPVGVNE